MPMPKGTYLQSKNADKASGKIADAKVMKETVDRKKKEDFERLMNKQKIQLRDFRKIIDDYKKVAEKPKDERARQALALAKVVEKLDDLSELISQNKELTSEVGQVAKDYSSKVKGFNTDAVDLTKALVALVVFIMALEKFYAKLKSVK